MCHVFEVVRVYTESVHFWIFGRSDSWPVLLGMLGSVDNRIWIRNSGPVDLARKSTDRIKTTKRNNDVAPSGTE